MSLSKGGCWAQGCQEPPRLLICAPPLSLQQERYLTHVWITISTEYAYEKVDVFYNLCFSHFMLVINKLRRWRQ
jgi:hypothetical protein